MSAQIADFNLRFNADTVKFQKDVDYAKKMLRGYTKEAKAANDGNASLTKSLESAADNAKSAGQNFLKVSGTVTGMVGAMVGATGYLITRQAEQAREIERMANVAQVSAEEIQAMSYAAQQYNINGDKMADILKDTNDKLGDFLENGGGEFKDFFDNIAPQVGLTAQELSRLSSPEVLVAVKNALDQANVPMKEQLSYLEKIADEASALTPLLENNGKKLYELTERYDKLNVAMSDYDIEKFKQMDQKLTDVSMKIERSFANAVVGSSQQIDWFTDKLVIAVNYWGTLFDSMSETPKTESGILSKLGDAQSDAKTTRILLERARKELEALKLTQKNAEGDLEMQAHLANARFGDKVDKAQAKVDKLANEYARLQALIDKYQEQYEIDVLGRNDTPPGSKPSTPPQPRLLTETAEQKNGAKQLNSFDDIYASDYQKMKAAHEQRLADIEALQLSEKEITERGYESIEAVKQAYREKEKSNFAQDKQRFEENQLEKLTAQQQASQRQIELIAAGENSALKQEEFAYEDRKAALAKQFSQAYSQAEGNQALQQELEDQYFLNREVLWEEHQSRLTDIEKTEAEKRKQYNQQVAADLLSFTSQQFGITLSALKDGGKESSRAYKVLFAAQKAAAIPSMIMATEEAATKALTLGPYAGPLMSGFIRTMGYASVGIASGQAIAGMAHSGIESIPREGTWLLDKGERVYTNESARKLDSMYEQVSRGRAADSGGDAFHFTIQALDAKNVEQILMNNREVIYGAVSSAKADRGESF
ncbi:hypothetical protein ATY35_09695 [Vibrio cidicii]|uniref:Bacteriophage tail tape measure N-terminal domain-containing protein n=1 Tax=Vibrio cidicii TaxID=1763883 RepID=A0ABR5W5R3_9VIBR|nr:hypothetical protein [Vibrio cidicii]KYN90554.1 hypothetical protein ATY35_09695 [Vibrio cidicii]